MPSPAELLRNYTEPVRELVRPLTGKLSPGDRPASTRLEERVTPWQWADQDGLYYGDDGAYLYRTLPVDLLTPLDGDLPLDHLLDHLSAALPGREVQLVTHTWETTAQAPAGTPAPLADYLHDGLAILVPVRSLILGVKLQASASGEDGKLLTLGMALLTSALGESVPDLSRYDADRARVADLLTGWAGPAPDRDLADYLESWFTLGNGPEQDVVDTQDALLVGEYGAIECAAVMGFDHAAGVLAAPLPAPGEGGATVVSVRGELTGEDAARKSDQLRAGTLSRCSIVLGRRVLYATDSWVEALRTQPGIELRPLPLRQLAALEETLPCARPRVSPTVHAVSAERLTRVGVRQPASAGDPLGLYLGLTDPDLAHPCYLNPTTGAPVTLITGGRSSGKTYLAENLAVQAAIAGLDVIYLTTTSGPSAVLELAGGLEVDLGRPGHLDPFAYTDPHRAAELTATVLRALVADMTDGEHDALGAAMRRGISVGATSLDRCLGMVTEPAAVARVRRAERRNLHLPLVTGAGQDVLFGSGVTLVDLAGALQTAAAPDGAVLVDLAVGCALEWAAASSSPAGCLIVCDDAAGLLHGPMTAASLDRLAGRGEQRVHLLAATSATTDAPGSALAARAGRVVALAEPELAAAAAAQQLVGLAPTPARSAWLADGAARIADGRLQRPAMGLHRDVHGRPSSLLVGPVPRRALSALTRGAVAY